MNNIDYRRERVYLETRSSIGFQSFLRVGKQKRLSGESYAARSADKIADV